MLQKTKAIFTLLFIPCFLMAQGWETTFGEEPVDDRGNSIQQTFDGGYIIAGETDCVGSMDCDILLLKLDKDGIEEWSTSLLPDEIGRGMSIVQTIDSGYVVCGTIRTNTFFPDIFVTKTDQNGEELWTTIIGDSLVANSFKITLLENNEFIVVGSFVNQTNFHREVLLSKLDQNGNELWTKKYPNQSDLFPEDMIVLENDNIAMVGGVLNNDIGTSFDYFLYLISPGGDSISFKSFGTEDNEGARTITELSTNELIIAGYWSGGGVNAVYKLDENGEEIWMEVISQNMYGGLSGSLGLVETEDNNIMLMTGTGKWIYLVKLNGSGSTIWEQKTGDISDTTSFISRGHDIQPASDGGFVIVGYKLLENLRDAYILKTDGNGDLVFTAEPGDKTNTLVKLFPNPSSNAINLELDETLIGAELMLFNALGQEVYRKTLQNTRSTHPLHHLDKGTYFYTINREGYLLASGKLIHE